MRSQVLSAFVAVAALACFLSAPILRARGLETVRANRAAGQVFAASTAKAPAASAPTAASTAGEIAHEIARIRTDLRSSDSQVRLAALRGAREVPDAGIQADVAALLVREPDPVARAVATQVVALADGATHSPLLRDLRANDPDPAVKFNATFGLARRGDEGLQEEILRAYDVASRDPKAPPGTLAMLGATLEDPQIRGRAVVSRLQAVAANPTAPASIREHARAVLAAKGIAPGS